MTQHPAIRLTLVISLATSLAACGSGERFIADVPPADAVSGASITGPDVPDAPIGSGSVPTASTLPLPPPETKPVTVTLDSTVLFPTGEFVLSEPGLQAIADAVSSARLQGDVVTCEAHGHTDDREPRPGFNDQLSWDRANSVSAVLTDLGCPTTPLGHGANDPAAPNDSDNGRAANRRVELVFHIRASQ